MEIPKDLKDELFDYCRANDITNIDEFSIKCLKQGYTIEKFGSTPLEVKQKVIEKIVEVEKIVEKEVFITDDKQAQILNDKLFEVQKQLSDKELKIIELNKIILELKNSKDFYGEG